MMVAATAVSAHATVPNGENPTVLTTTSENETVTSLRLIGLLLSKDRRIPSSMLGSSSSSSLVAGDGSSAVGGSASSTGSSSPASKTVYQARRRLGLDHRYPIPTWT
jgi:hypothetical protein